MRDLSCWICGSRRLRRVKDGNLPASLTSSAFAITSSAYGVTGDLDQCADCGFLQCSRLNKVVEFYETLEDIAYDHGRAERGLQAQRVLSRVPERNRRGKLLDVGAGSGILVEQALECGYDAEGIEPSRWLCERAIQRTLPVLQGTLPHAQAKGPYDVVTVIDVIEHVDDPVDLLRQVAMVLKPEGIVVVVTPDIDSIAARVMKWKWWHFRVSHIGYFNRQTLAAAAMYAGLRICHVSRPTWYFHAGYIIDRVNSYLPRVLRFKYPDFIRNTVVPLDLRDSMLVMLVRV